MAQKHYFVCMRSFRTGLEAIVDPEITRRKMIDRIVSGEWNNIEWVHEVRDYDDGQPIITTDITEEVMNEANALQLVAAE